MKKIIAYFTSRNIFPQFIYERIKNTSLAGKLNLIIMISALPVLLILFVIFILLFFQLSADIDHQMKQKMLATKNAYNYFERQTRVYAKMIAENPFIKKELLAETANAGPILRVCKQVQDSVLLDKITIHDRKGYVVAKSHEPADFGQLESDQKDIKEALHSGKNSALLHFDGKFMVLQNTVAVYFENEIIGSVTTGYKLDYHFANRINKLTQANIFFVHNKSITSTSLGQISPRKKNIEQYFYRHQNGEESVRRKVRFFKEKKKFKSVTFDFRYIPIVTAPSVKTKPVSKSGILIALNQESARLYLQLLLTVSLVLAALVLIGALILALKISNSISSFTVEISEAMQTFSHGNLKTRIKVTANDELGQVAHGFNAMAKDLEDKITLIENSKLTLEKRVTERTKELQETLEVVTQLKELQEGDYMLASLLLKPFYKTSNDSKVIASDHFIMQKKKYNYRGRTGDIGGDICYLENLIFENQRFLFFFNGDAMGKSIQGASGSLICGLTLHSIMRRPIGQDTKPDKWLARVYKELHNVFLNFDGIMMMSAAFGLINEKTKEMYYFNSEHPHTVLLRDNQANFIDQEISAHKLGVRIGNKKPFIYKFQLHKKDIIILGSDGRDDLGVTKNGITKILSLPNKFPCKVKKSLGNIESIVKIIKDEGEITDDLSFIRIEIL